MSALKPVYFSFSQKISDTDYLHYRLFFERSNFALMRKCCCCAHYTVVESLSVCPVELLSKSFFAYLSTGRLSYRSFASRKLAFHSFFTYLESSDSLSLDDRKIYDDYLLNS